MTNPIATSEAKSDERDERDQPDQPDQPGQTNRALEGATVTKLALPTWREPGRILRGARVLAGNRVLAWLVFGTIASVVLASVEVGVAVVLQLLLKNLGLLSTNVDTMPLLKRLAPSNLELGGLLLVIAVVRAIGQYVSSQSGSVAQEAITARLRRFAVYEMLLSPKRASVNAANIQAHVGDISLKASHFAYYFAGLLAAGIQAGALVVIMFFAAPREACIALLGLGVVGVAVLKVSRRAQAIVEKVPDELRILTRGIERVARNSTLVRVLRTEDEEHGRLARAIDRYEAHSVSAARLSSGSVAMTPFFGVILIMVVLGTSQSVLHTPPLLLVSFLYLFMRFVQSLSVAVSMFSMCNQVSPQFRESLAYALAIEPHEIELAVKVRPERAPPKVEARREDGTAPEIKIAGLRFRYPRADADVLKGLSLDIPRGAQIGIVGPSGCGKSTLLSVLLGVLTPTEGTVTIGGLAPMDYFAREDVRVGYVGAESFLVAGAVRDNLTYGARIHATEDALWEALGKASLEHVVRELPGGLDYPIGEDGSGLSAGQKQRLCLARAMLTDPHVLVLDEASANLDEGTEIEIAQTLAQLVGRTTVVIVSHRRGILANTTHVLDLSVV